MGLKGIGKGLLQMGEGVVTLNIRKFGEGVGRSFYNYADTFISVVENAPDVIEDAYDLITLKTKDEGIRRIYKDSVKSSLGDLGERFFGDDFDDVFRNK